MRKIALDLGVRKTACCEVKDGTVVQRATVTSVENLSSLLGPKAEPAVVAIEACREAWHVHDLLRSWGNEVVLVDTTRSRRLGIGQHGRKTDRIDAEVLALALERGGIPIAHVLSPHRRELRRWLSVRRALVESRANFVTTCRGLAREQGVVLPKCQAPVFAKKARQFAGKALEVIEPLLKQLEAINPELVAVARRALQLGARCRATHDGTGSRTNDCRELCQCRRRCQAFSLSSPCRVLPWPRAQRRKLWWQAASWRNQQERQRLPARAAR